MADARLKLFAFDEGASRGPLPSEEICRAIALGEIKASARFRADPSHAWLPGAAWEALAEVLPSPRPPPAPSGPGETSLPDEIAATPPAVREHLLWFVADEDGVMGPVGGDFIVKGIKTNKIPITALITLASWSDKAAWVRAPLVFPAANVGVTTIRKRPLPTRACAYCLEPVATRDVTCAACGEPTRPVAGPAPAQRAIAVAAALVLTAAAAFGGAWLARRAARGRPAPALEGGGAAGQAGARLQTPAAAPAEAAEPAAPGSAAAGPRAGAEAPRARGHLATGEIAGRFDVAKDAADALALSENRIAIARGDALDVIDSRNGALVFVAADLAGARALYPVHGGGAPAAAYAAIGERLAALDPRTARVAAWIDAGGAPARVEVAIDRGIAALVHPERQALMILDAGRHAALARPPIEEPIASVAIADGGRIALAIAGGAGPSKRGAAAAAGPQPVYAFAPTLRGARADDPAGAAPDAADAPPWGAGRAVSAVRRLDLGEAPVAVAVSADGAFGAAVLRGRAELVRIDLGPSASLAPAGPRVKTCADPAHVAIAAGVIVVACGGGRTASLHDGDTLAALASIELGGPAIGLDVAPDRAQALVTVGAPANAVALIDLRKREGRAVAAGEPVSPARYGLGGRVATALASRSHRVLVLR
ncbi:MAG: hypothetical protein IT372_25295 [Polyangiaceae bacterium]|nr:hypothetical protein [Polyangiaceae bacterium]